MIISQRVKYQIFTSSPFGKGGQGISNGNLPGKIPLRNENGLGEKKKLMPTTGNDIQDGTNAEINKLESHLNRSNSNLLFETNLIS
jgi:hypothetical protein